MRKNVTITAGMAGLALVASLTACGGDNGKKSTPPPATTVKIVTPADCAPDGNTVCGGAAALVKELATASLNLKRKTPATITVKGVTQPVECDGANFPQGQDDFAATCDNGATLLVSKEAAEADLQTGRNGLKLQSGILNAYTQGDLKVNGGSAEDPAAKACLNGLLSGDMVKRKVMTAERAKDVGVMATPLDYAVFLQGLQKGNCST